MREQTSETQWRGVLDVGRGSRGVQEAAVHPTLSLYLGEVCRKVASLPGEKLPVKQDCLLSLQGNCVDPFMPFGSLEQYFLGILMNGP